MSANWKTQQWPQDWKRSVFIPIPNKVNAKECLNCHSIVLTSQTRKIMLKILQARLQHYGNRELKMYKMGFEEAEKSEIKLPTFVGSWRKQSSSRNKSTFASLTMPKPLTVWITTNCRQFLKRWEYQTTLLVF